MRFGGDSVLPRARGFAQAAFRGRSKFRFKRQEMLQETAVHKTKEPGGPGRNKNHGLRLVHLLGPWAPGAPNRLRGLPSLGFFSRP